ncbi:hypothetical protein F441_02894 [Phytophthora nicotianae CJ01A1]|uniref:START domain-containing protein n=1 Tax=Phytophthora nicotianae CJ01A1 TaxID=1317063 RepID=W2XMD0_PHYNI|nr:hypothetical protein F441_02894 [Phytophthora nicotianae CJ01A1]
MMERKRLRGVPYSTQLQRRKRVWTNALQLEVQALSSQLAELQAARQDRIKDVATGTNDSDTSTSRWRGLATIESEKRCRAEKLNRELKSLLTEQLKLRAPVLKMIRRKEVLEGIEFVLQLQPKVQQPLREPNFGDLVLDEMESSLDWLRLDTDTMLSAMDDSTKISFRWQHIPLSNCIQSSSITPVSCTVQQIGEMLWRHASNTKKASDSSFRYVRRKTPTPLDMNAVASMVEGVLCSNAVTTFRKYDEGDRIILVGSTKWFLPSGQLLLQDYSWTVISPSPGNGQEACMMRHCYKLEMARPSPTCITEEQKLMFHTVSSKMRNAYQAMQDHLLSSAVLG